MRKLTERLDESFNENKFTFGENKNIIILNDEIEFHTDDNGFKGIKKVGEKELRDIKKDDFAKTAYKKYSDDVLKFKRG